MNEGDESSSLVTAPPPPNSNTDTTATITTTASKELQKAFLTFHRYHSSLTLDNDQTMALKNARDILSTASFDVLSTKFHLKNNDEFRRACLLELGREGACQLFGTHSLMALPIHLAALLGNFGLVDLCLKRGCSEGKKTVDNYGRIPLVYAIVGGCIDVVKLLIEMYPQGVSTKTIAGDANNTTCLGILPVHFAAWHGRVEIIQLLFESCPDTVLQKSCTGDLPLHCAIIAGHELAVKILVDKYPAGVKVKGQYDRLPLHMAAEEKGHVGIARYLLDLYPEAISANDDDGDMPIHLATMKGHLEMIKFLVTKDPDMVKAKGENGQLPSHCAAEFGHLVAFKYLHGVHPEGSVTKDDNKDEPIHLAANNGRINIVQFLLGKYPDKIKTKGGTCQGLPIHDAAYSGTLEMSKYLFAKYPLGASALDNCEDTPLHNAASRGHIETTKFFNQVAPSTVLHRNERGYLPIDIATKEDHLEIVKTLLEINLSSNTFATIFAVELFRHHMLQNDDEDDETEDSTGNALWERRDTAWSMLIDKFGSEVLLQVEAFKAQPVLFASIGKIPVTEIEFIIDLLQVRLAELTDDQDHCILTAIIKEASKGGEEQWEPYFEPLLKLINSRLHRLDVDGNHLRARGNGITCNILHNASLNGLPWYALGSICLINVDSLIVPLDESGLYPFMLPSVTSTEEGEDGNSDLDCEEQLMRSGLTYQMLLMRPDAIKVATKDDGKNADDDLIIERSAKRSRIS